MQKLGLFLALAGLVAVFSQEISTEIPLQGSSLEPEHENNGTEHGHRRHGPILSKETFQKLREIFDKEQPKEERQKAVEELLKSLNEKEQKHAQHLAKRLEKVKELEDKLSADAKAALQKLKDLKKQEHEVFKGLSEDDRKALGRVFAALRPRPPRRNIKKLKNLLRKGRKGGQKGGEQETSTVAAEASSVHA